MDIRRIIALILTALTLASFNAGAQTERHIGIGEKHKSGTNLGVSKSDMSRVTGGSYDANATVIEKSKYNDASLSDLEKKMAERDWASEDTAWKRASATNTMDAYKRYVAIYPNGAHRADAESRMVDLNVKDIFNAPHNNLPPITQVEADFASVTSTIVVENLTRYPMTVYYSGTKSSSMVISPGCKSSITISNGTYKIAASVPDPNVKPFAGMQTFTGGSYQTGFIIVRNGYRVY